jgi:hypothetical protein
MKTLTKAKTKPAKKGFQPAQKIHANDLHTFSCECLWYDAATDEELLTELWTVKLDKRRFRTDVRQAIVTGLIYCFLETPEAVERHINRVFFWNNKSRAYEPLGAVSDLPMDGSSPVDFEADPVVAYERLKALCVEIEVIKVDDCFCS